jgi:hypothetical protein
MAKSSVLSEATKYGEINCLWDNEMNLSDVHGHSTRLVLQILARDYHVISCHRNDYLYGIFLRLFRAFVL